MFRSDAPRERLIKPWQLIAIILIFAIAFFIIAPKQKELTLSDQDVDSSISELDLAYLRAQRPSDQQAANDVLAAATALVRAQRVDEADELLASRPDVELSKIDQFALTMERAAAGIVAQRESENPDQQLIERNESSIVSVLNQINQDVTINRMGLLRRSQQLAGFVEEPSIAASLSERLARLDPETSSRWFKECANLYEYVNEINKALSCATQNVEVSQDRDERFSARLLELKLVSRLGDQPATYKLVNELLESKGATLSNLNSLAEQLLQIERPLDAARTYAKISKVDPVQSVKWLSLAARWSEAGGKPGEAAAYLDIARPFVDDPQKATVDENIARLLLAAGDNNAVLSRYLKKINEGDVSLKMLQTAIKAALGSNNTALASEWNSLLVQHHPGAIQGWVNQYDLSLATTDLPAALAAAKTLVDLEPDNPDHHVRLARVAEWTGDPNLATSEWLWLSERYPSMDYLTELTRLSTLTQQPTLTAEALRQRSMQQRPTSDQLAQLIAAYELEGRPNDAVLALENLLNRYGKDAHIMERIGHIHKRHVNFVGAYEVWQRYEEHFGKSVKSQLNLLEMAWRTDKGETAVAIAKGLPSTLSQEPRGLDQATDYQVRLVSELSWRYSIDPLVKLSEPYLYRIEEKSLQSLQQRRAIDLAQKEGRIDQAIASAAELAAASGASFAKLLHMRLLVETLRDPSERNEQYEADVQPYLAANNETVELRQLPGYWSLVAQYHLNRGDVQNAQRAYQTALTNNPDSADALTGLLWMYIANNDRASIASFVETHESRAEKTPSLWTPFAMAYMQLQLPRHSLRWFERQIDAIEADYGLLLTYADALEAAGRADNAYRVRHYAIDALRPLLAQGTEEERNRSLQQYSRMVSRFGRTDQKERFTVGVLQANEESVIKQDQFWQQEMAITWLMATQRHDVARVILSKLHEQRLEAPAWQALAVAIKQDELDTVAQIVQQGQGISVGDNLLALRKLGRENEAYASAINALQAGLTGNDGVVAAQTYRELRRWRPGFAGASVNNTVAPGFGVLESSVIARHTFAGTTFGVSVDARRRQFDSDRYILDDEDDVNDVAVTLHYGGSGLHSRLTAGYIADGEISRTYVVGGVGSRFSDGRHGFDLEVAINETPDASSILQLRGMQNRAKAAIDASLGRMGYMGLSASATDIKTRESEEKISQGVSGYAELGIRGTMGSHSWSTSIAANHETNDRVDTVPTELELNNQVSMNEVIRETGSSLSFGGSLSRGDITTDYPQVNSPRYYVNARVGHSWPEKNFGVQFDAGAGVRVIGGDELSLGFSHDGLVSDFVGEGRSKVGVNYRFHFQ